MQLGKFSVSLSVTDILASVKFYKALGFEQTGGDLEQNWCVLKNGEATIGLFQGMLEGNLLTFNPKWNQNGQIVETMDDIRAIKAHLKAQQIKIDGEEATTDEVTFKDPDGTILEASPENEEGPAFFTVKDPDGNIILFDQHV